MDADARVLAAWLPHAWLLAFCLGALGYALQHPTMNWDMVAYAGAAKAWDTSDERIVHDFAYDELRGYADDAAYADLTIGSDYRSLYRQDPEAFRQALSWYRIRPLYTGAMNLLHKAGVGIYDAAHLLPAVAAVLGVLAFYLAFRRHLDGALWVSVPFFLTMNGTVATARLATPDGMAYLGVAIVSGLFLHRHRTLLWVLPLIVLIRTDLIVLVGLMLGYRFATERADRAAALVSLAVAVGLYLLINRWAGNHGWSAVFYLVFVSHFDLNYPETATYAVTLADYGAALRERLPVLLQSDEFAAYAAVVALTGALALRLDGARGSARRALLDPLYALPLIGLSYVTIHFLVFPAGLPRFYAAHYTAAFLTLLAILTRMCRRLEGPPGRRPRPDVPSSPATGDV